METITGTTLGLYHLTSFLARGGMSDIYLASNVRTGQVRALKVVHWEDEERSLRFQREVEVLTALKYPHLLPMLETGV